MSNLIVNDIKNSANQIYYRQNNILGTVTESSGVPTGAVIERGSNANGEFVKYADGTLQMVVPYDVTGGNTAIGDLFRTDDITVTFPATPTTFLIFVAGRSISSGRWVATGSYNTGGNSIGVRHYSPSSFTTNLTNNRLFVSGRWY
jgi:hypothetical protein